jgi:large subunit ribosomal protein L10e
MRRAFGKSTGLAARIRPGQVIYEAYIMAANLELAQDAFKMAASKIGRPTTTRITPLKEHAVAAAEED